MKLTKRRALEICVELWLWLAKHPNKTKKDWPGWKFNGGQIAEMVNLCPCCEYSDVECEHCLIQWPGEDGRCSSLNTPWTDWFYAECGERKTIAAKGIVALAKEALGKHNRRYPKK